MSISPVTSTRVHSREHLSCYKRYSIDYKVATEPVNNRNTCQSYSTIGAIIITTINPKSGD